MPYYLVPKQYEHIRTDLMTKVQNLALAAQMIARNTKNAVKDAWIDKEASSRGDLSFVETEFWNATEAAYYSKVDIILEELMKGNSVSTELIQKWLAYLNKESLRIFDLYADQVSMDSGKVKNPAASGEGREIPRVISARSSLINFNNGNIIKEILGLEVMTQTKAKKSGGKNAKSK
jgi:CRISPR system Cascade subunit CasA